MRGARKPWTGPACTRGQARPRVGAVLLLVAVSMACSRPRPAPQGPAAPELHATSEAPSAASATAPSSDYQLPFGSSPFAPAEARLAGTDRIPAGSLTGSARCGECHPRITAQWQSSLHRHAASDLFYRLGLEVLSADFGLAMTRLCVGCHEPDKLLSWRVNPGREGHPMSRLEGISCLSCHLITATHEAEQQPVVANASYTLSPLPEDVLFPDGDDQVALARHGQALRRPFLSDNRFCASCHRFFIPTQAGGYPPGRVRLQSAEAEGTPFGDPHHPDYQSCVDCHMPLITADDPAAKDGQVHDHRSLGSNTWIPALAGDDRQVQATLAFRREGAVHMDVQPFERGERGALRLPVVLTNDRNGHDFPTGATDISEVWLELTLQDAAGAVVFQSPGLDDDAYLSDAAPSLNSIVALASGDMDFMHNIIAQSDLRRHPRIKPGASRRLAFDVTLPADVTPPLVARVTLRARHGNGRWNDWTFNYEDVSVPVAVLGEAEARLDVIPPVIPAGMVAVAGGVYWIGANPRDDARAELAEYPRHQVELAPFFIDATPVTNAEYAEAVRADVVPPPEVWPEPPYAKHVWTGPEPPEGMEDHPVVLVTPDEAVDYCRFRGKRLPRELEWEAAARGTDGRRYPWGEDFDAARCNTLEAGVGTTEPVGSRPGNRSPTGALDMGCNVSEWVLDTFKPWPRVRQPDNRADWVDQYDMVYNVVRVFRGASYNDPGYFARASQRGRDTYMHRKLVGFRCALTPLGAEP